jgi:hypothetical protein
LGKVARSHFHSAIRVPDRAKDARLRYWEAKDEEDDLEKEIEKKFQTDLPEVLNALRDMIEAAERE